MAPMPEFLQVVDLRTRLNRAGASRIVGPTMTPPSQTDSGTSAPEENSVAQKTRCRFGLWPSPLAAGDVAAGDTVSSLLKADGDRLLWTERRPQEAGRIAIVGRDADGATGDLIAAPYSARSRVHEYGGGALAARGGMAVFVNDADQDLYRLGESGPHRLTEYGDLRFADMDITPDGQTLYTVVERHDADLPHPQNLIAAVALDGSRTGSVTMVLAGRDFYAAPRISPDGTLLAWLAWDLPHMPWEEAELWLGTLNADGSVTGARQLVGSGAFQPEWAADGRLHVIADHAGWGMPHVWDGGALQPVLADEIEFTRPQWAFGMTSYAILETGRLIAAGWRDGRIELGLVTVDNGGWEPRISGFTRIDEIAVTATHIAIIGADDETAAAVHLFERDTGEFHPRTAAPVLPSAAISRPVIVTLPGSTPAVRTLHYPPASGTCMGPDGDLPPMVVSAHGGPTGMAKRGLALDRQFWTSRGFAFLDVDYRGSSGYGRRYVELLDGHWGAFDAEDVVRAAEHMAGTGLCDPDRIVIRGSSAGGLTVLNALALSDLFAAGASLYGVTDLVRLAADTHKFEAGYLFSLIGGEPDEIPDIYRSRSPVFNAERITAPMIFFQGLDDVVVPPSQTRTMADSLRTRGIPVALLEFPGEGHGFRRAETVIRALEAELTFYRTVLRLDDQGPDDLTIDNWQPAI